MIFEHVSKLRWKCEDIDGFIVDIKTSKKETSLIAINKSTGEIVRNLVFPQTLDAIRHVSSLKKELLSEIHN